MYPWMKYVQLQTRWLFVNVSEAPGALYEKLLLLLFREKNYILCTSVTVWYYK